MSVLEKLIEQRDALVLEASDLLAGEASDENFTLAQTRMTEAEALEPRIATAKSVEERKAAIDESRKAAGITPFASVKVGKEPMTYDKGSRTSYFKDLAFATTRNDTESWARMNRHAQEMDVESRANSTTSTAGGDFVPPAYLLAEFAEYARAQRVGANLLTNIPLTEKTSTIKIPAITTGSKVRFQAGNNQTVTTRDLVTSTVSADVQTLAGYVPVSMQLLEQSPINMDEIIFADLIEDYTFALAQSVVSNDAGTSNDLRGMLNVGVDTTNGIPTTWTETTPTVAGLYIAVAKALSAVANNRFRPSEAVLMSASTWYWTTAQVDSTGRPLVVPTVAGVQNAIGKNDASGASAGLVGTIQGVPVYIDATMTKVYATNQSPILVGKFSDSYLFESAPKSSVHLDTAAKEVQAIFRTYSYVALVHRFAKSFSAISGTGSVAQAGY